MLFHLPEPSIQQHPDRFDPGVDIAVTTSRNLMQFLDLEGAMGASQAVNEIADVFVRFIGRPRHSSARFLTPCHLLVSTPDPLHPHA